MSFLFRSCPRRLLLFSYWLCVVAGIDLRGPLEGVFSIRPEGTRGLHKSASLKPSKSSGSILGLHRTNSSRFAVSTELRSTTTSRDVDVPNVPLQRQELYFRPVSVTLYCVMTMVVTSLVFFTTLSISRNMDELSGSFNPSVLTQTLTVAGRVAGFAPMMCMLFMSCRMYVLSATDGLGEPQIWVKVCMCIAVAGIFSQLVIVLLLPNFMRKQAENDAYYDMTEGNVPDRDHLPIPDDTQPPTEEEIRADVEGGADMSMEEMTGEHNDVHPVLRGAHFMKDLRLMPGLLWAWQVASVVITYASLLVVIVGIFVFPSQKKMISPAIICTIGLSIIYLLVCLLLWIARSLPKSLAQEKFENAALAMSSIVRKAPMFAALFLASRMRSLQIDPPDGLPPFRARCYFYVIVVCFFFELMAAAFVGACGEIEKAYYGHYIFRTEHKALHVAQHFFAVCTYVTAEMLKEDLKFRHAMELSTTVGLVAMFAFMYFFVYFLIDIVLLLEEVKGAKMQITRDVCLSAGISLGLAPSLCILFVAARMRALQITQQQGEPQGWAQDFMYLGMFATCTQSLCCLMMPLFVGASCKTDADGNIDYDLKPMIGAYAVSVVKYVSLLILHVSVIGICVAIFIITPETAHGDDRALSSVRCFLEGALTGLIIFFVALMLSSAKVIGLAFKFAIESCDRKILGVDLSCRVVKVNPWKGYIHVKDLIIHQPTEEIEFTRDSSDNLIATKTGNTCTWRKEYLGKVDLILIKVRMLRLIYTQGKVFELENLSCTGITIDIEKPDADLAHRNFNIEYILNHLEIVGLVRSGGHPDSPLSDKLRQTSYESEASVDADQEENYDCEDVLDMPKVFLHKMALGNVEVSVLIKNAPVVGDVSFSPHIGLLEYEDVQRDVFKGREDLTPGQYVAFIVKAFVEGIFKKVGQEIPQQLAELALRSVTNTAEAVHEVVADGKDWLTGR